MIQGREYCVCGVDGRIRREVASTVWELSELKRGWVPSSVSEYLEARAVRDGFERSAAAEKRDASLRAFFGRYRVRPNVGRRAAP